MFCGDTYLTGMPTVTDAYQRGLHHLQQDCVERVQTQGFRKHAFRPV